MLAGALGLYCAAILEVTSIYRNYTGKNRHISNGSVASLVVYKQSKSGDRQSVALRLGNWTTGGAMRYGTVRCDTM